MAGQSLHVHWCTLSIECMDCGPGECPMIQGAKSVNTSGRERLSHEALQLAPGMRPSLISTVATVATPIMFPTDLATESFKTQNLVGK